MSSSLSFPSCENVQVAASVGGSFLFLCFIKKARAEPLGEGSYSWVLAIYSAESPGIAKHQPPTPVLLMLPFGQQIKIENLGRWKEHLFSPPMPSTQHQPRHMERDPKCHWSEGRINLRARTLAAMVRSSEDYTLNHPQSSEVSRD